MSDVENAISYVFAWHALSDACPKCQALNGREWREQDLFQNMLWDPIYGDIWNLDASHTLAHPNCRCQLEVRVERVEITPEIVAELVSLTRMLNEELRLLLEAVAT